MAASIAQAQPRKRPEAAVASERRDSMRLRLDAALELGISGLLALLLFAAVAFMGGRYDWGWLAWSESAFVGIIAAAALLWLGRLMLRPQLGLVCSWSIPLLAAGGLVGLLQLAPLPAWLLRLCSPGLAAVLPLWPAASGNAPALGVWNRISIVPHCTAESLRYLALYSLTFFLVIQNVRTLTAVKRLLLAVFALGVATASCGLIQHLCWNGKFYGFFDIPFVPAHNFVHSPFTNKNHFAGLLAMTVGPGCYWLLSALGLLATGRSSTSKRIDVLMPVVCFTLGCILTASFLSVSRGGILATTLAFVAAAGGLAWFARARQIWLMGAILICLILAGFLAFAGTEKIEQRFEAIAAEQMDGEHLDGRLELWRALLRSVPDFPVLGTGLGSHRHMYRLYLEKFTPSCYSHAENSYLQLLVEGGIVTALLTALALGCVVYWCVRGLRGGCRPEAKPCVVAILSALLATAFHGCVDFVWYIPSHALLLAVLTGLACALARVQHPGKTAALPIAPRWLAGSAAVVGAVLFALWLQTSYHHAQAAQFWTEFQLSPDGKYPLRKAARTNDVALLDRALEQRPDQPLFHAMIGDVLLQQFFQSPRWQGCPMPLMQISEAVGNSQFAAAAQRDRWLDAVYGSDNRKRLISAREHYLQAVRLQPLQAELYLRLAELDFLAEPTDPRPAALLAQAMKADPYNPDVSYQAGTDFLQLGDEAQAIQCWRQSASGSETHKQTILAQLSTVVKLPTLIEQFQPDYHSLIWLTRQCFAGKERRQERLCLLSEARKLTLNEHDPVVVGPRMTVLFEAFVQEGDQAQADQCVRTAALAQPNLLERHLALARWLLKQGHPKEAKAEISWCASREPGNPEVRALQEAAFDALHSRRKEK